MEPSQSPQGRAEGCKGRLSLVELSTFGNSKAEHCEHGSFVDGVDRLFNLLRDIADGTLMMLYAACVFDESLRLEAHIYGGLPEQGMEQRWPLVDERVKAEGERRDVECS